MENYNVIVCAPTKNCASYIEKQINKLLEFKTLFKTLDILIYENDSNDNSVDILKKLENQGKINLISEKGINKLRIRTLIIAHARNKLVEYAIDKNKYDYIIMLDIDINLQKFDLNNIRKAFSYDNDSWDVLTANCTHKYYDIWALRISKKQWSDIHAKIWKKCIDFDCWDMINHKKGGRIQYIKEFQKKIPYDSPLIPVTSAFGGMGIYKISKIKNCKYEGFTRQCSCKNYNVNGKCRFDTVDHASFHDDMITKNNAKLFICPQLIVDCQTEHLL